MNSIEAYIKLDHTFCMNANENHIEYNIDKEEYYGTEYEGEYDPSNTDCKSLEEAVDCLDIIHDSVFALNVILNKSVDMGELLFLIKREGNNAVSFYNFNKHASRALTMSEFKLILKAIADADTTLEVIDEE